VATTAPPSPPARPARTAAPPLAVASHSSSSSGFRLVLFGLLALAVLAIGVAAVPPWILRPYRLAALVAERRSGTAMIGIAGIVSIGAAYLLTRSGG
jgi:hypothetical protein